MERMPVCQVEVIGREAVGPHHSIQNPVALLTATDRRWCAASFHSIVRTGDTLPQKSPIYRALCFAG